MANQVFANGMEIACKAGAGKVIAAFPDVCMTPPENPATPPGIPVPYPNTAMASDTTDGSKNVKISGDEIMLKNKSCFKTSTGDEAGCAAKKGVVSSKNKGKVYFVKWSMDVKVEGENVDRHMDMTTNNHGSPLANEGVPWVFVDQSAVSNDNGVCKKEADNIKEKCKPEPIKNWKKNHCPPKPVSDVRKLGGSDLDKYISDIKKKACVNAMKCRLIPYKSRNTKTKGCCPGQTAHHLVPKATLVGVGLYDPGAAPCICVEGPNHGAGTHGLMHTLQSYAARAFASIKRKTGKNTSLKKIQANAAKTATAVFTDSGCSSDCLEAQLKYYHQDTAKIDANQSVDPPATNHPSPGAAKDAIKLARKLAGA